MPASPELIEAINNWDAEEGLLVLEPRAEYDQFIVGVVRRFHDTFIVYDQKAILEHIAADSTPDDGQDPMEAAMEHFEFNMVGGWHGDGTWGFISTEPDEL